MPKRLMGHNEINNIGVMGIPEGKVKRECIFKAIMFENFLNLKREIDTRIHEAKRTRSGLSLNRAIARNIIIKILKAKNKETILKASR